MRGLRSSVVLAALALYLPCLPAHADGEVLVPEDDTNKSGSSSTTLLPSSGGSSDDVLLPTSDAPKSSGVTASGAGEVRGFTPIPGAPSATTGTHIVKMAAPPALSAPADPETSTSDGLNIDIADKFVWGANDISHIGSQLGYSAEDIAQHCHPSINGSIDTDNDGFAGFNTGPYLTHAKLEYSGKPTSMGITVEAMCDVAPLRPDLGYVVQLGNKYAVAIGKADCAPPPSDAHHVIYHYEGDGKASCEYQ